LTSVRYEIVVAAEPSPFLGVALEDFEMTSTDTGCLRLVGTLADQAALHGALHRLQDLQVEILEVRPIDLG
jgi:hypothetical protein